jgi:DNA-binding NarL/FixJ family response regulator
LNKLRKKLILFLKKNLTAMKKTNILLVEDEKILRELMGNLLKQEPFVEAVYEAWDEETLTDVMTNHRVDVILLDMKLRGISGLELFAKVKSFDQTPRVIAVTGLEGRALMVNLLKAGIDSIIHKFDGYSEVFKTISNMNGSVGYISAYVRRVIQECWNSWDEIPSVILSPKEKEFIKALADGLTASEIAPLFNMTTGSIEQFKAKLMKKIGVRNTAALLAFAFRNGLI